VTIPFLTAMDGRAKFTAAKWFDDWTSLAPVGSLSGQERAEAGWHDAANRRHERGGCRCDTCSEVRIFRVEVRLAVMEACLWQHLRLR
jgi:hypothetical protein